MQINDVIQDAIYFNQKELQSRKNSNVERHLHTDVYLNALRYLSERGYQIRDEYQTDFFDEFNEYYDIAHNVIQDGAPDMVPNHSAIEDMLIFQRTYYDKDRISIMQNSMPFEHVFMVEILTYEQHPEDIQDYLNYNMFHSTLISASHTVIEVLEQYNECNVTQVRYQNNKIQFLSDNSVVATIRYLRKHDFWRGSKDWHKRISTSLKGLSNNTASDDIKYRLQDFIGLSGARWQTGCLLGHDPFVPLNNTINDQVTIYRQIIEHLTGKKPSLSEARELYLITRNVNNWHSLKASEKKHDTETYVVIEIDKPEGWDGDEYTFLGSEAPSPSIINCQPVASLADVYLYINHYLSSRKNEDRSVRISKGIPSVVMNDRLLLVIADVVDYNKFDMSETFSEQFNCPEVLSAITQITQHIDKGLNSELSFMINAPLALNCIYHTEINGYRIYVEDNNTPSYGPTLRIETDRHYASCEIENLLIGKSEKHKGELAIYRGFSSERSVLTHFGKEGIKTFLSLFSCHIGMFDDEIMPVPINQIDFKSSVIYQAIEEYYQKA